MGSIGLNLLKQHNHVSFTAMVEVASSAKNMAAAFFAPSITVAELQTKYVQASKFRTPKVRILIVPGHEPDFGGTAFGGVNERDVVVDVAQELAKFFENNSRYDVIVARGKESWNPEIQAYFDANEQVIKDFVSTQKTLMQEHIHEGNLAAVTNGIQHNKAPSKIAFHLYGINKWANENDVDITLHLHFNDHPRKNTRIPGVYEGFAIYVPESQFSNAIATHAVAENIRKRLLKYNNQSTFGKESAGIIESQDLIAIGSYNTAESASMLIEYAYIYEPKVQNTNVRDMVMKDFAFHTYLGIQDFFGSGNDVNFLFDTVSLPYAWTKPLGTEPSIDTYALQIALANAGYYPGKSSFIDCPITGRFGPCTKAALTQFQKDSGITGESGILGEKTRELMNRVFGVQAL
jgi:N-acetylmuramoyl-L-alanine amidase